jgi:hypothetical protein
MHHHQPYKAINKNGGQLESNDGKKTFLYHQEGGDPLGSVVKKRRKKMRKHKHRKLLARTRHQRRKGK